MIGIDTNVLVRYLVRDDPVQTPRAERLLNACTPADPAFVNRVVLCEVAWVLRDVYRYPRALIADAMERVLMIGGFVVEDARLAWSALHEFRNSRADFADCLLGLVNREVGCRTTYTFDGAAANLTMFAPL